MYYFKMYVQSLWTWLYLEISTLQININISIQKSFYLIDISSGQVIDLCRESIDVHWTTRVGNWIKFDLVI